MSSTLDRLSEWYQMQCDGDWEHSYSVEIGTLDNPGWHMKIDLTETALEGKAFENYKDKYDSEKDWLRCWLEGKVFHAACGPGRLEDAILLFLKWAEVGAQNGKEVST